MVGLQQRARRDQFGAPGVHGDLRVAGHGRRLALVDQAQSHGQTFDTVAHGLQSRGIGRARLVHALVGVALEDLRKQRVGLHLRIAHQANAGGGPGVGGRGAELAFGKWRDLCAVAALAGGQVQHFNEGALADDQLTSHSQMNKSNFNWALIQSFIAFGNRCKEMGVRPSRGTVGDAFDNAMAKSFFASLECALIARRTWKTKTEARLAVFTWIEGWYNPRRHHSGLNCQSPNNFKRKHQEDANNTETQRVPELQ